MSHKVLLYSLITLFSFYTAENKTPQGLSSITSNDLMKLVNYFSSGELEGRLAGGEGYFKAADTVRQIFENLNLSPPTTEGYYQEFLIEYNRIKDPILLEMISKDNVRKKFELGKDFTLRGFTGSGNFTAPVVFCGYGLSAPEANYDDYAGIDVEGKIVMVFKSNPGWRIDDLDWGSGYPRDKSNTALDHGAKGILFVSKPNDRNPQSPIGSVMSGKGEQPENFPQFHIDIAVADEFLAGMNLRLTDLQTFIDNEKTPKSVELSAEAAISVETDYTPEQRTVNVIAVLEGNDPELKNEYLVIGAHLDHVGKQGSIYFPGANDNASGAAAVTEIAEAFALGRDQVKRSIIFVLFSSEESGLHGSSYFVDNPPVPIEKIMAMINLDCVGYGDSIMVGNGGSAPELWGISKKMDSEYIRRMVDRTWSGGGADASPFHEKKIPSIYFVTTNSYKHLHLPSDTPETLNKVLYEDIVKLAYLTAREVAGGVYRKERIRE